MAKDKTETQTPPVEDDKVETPAVEANAGTETPATEDQKEETPVETETPKVVTESEQLGESLDITPPVEPVVAVASGVEYVVIKPFQSTDKATHGKRVNYGFVFKSGTVFSEAYTKLLVNVGHVVENTKEIQQTVMATKASVQSQQVVEGTMVVGSVDSIIGTVASSEAILVQE
jgi:hypothetical protein